MAVQFKGRDVEIVTLDLNGFKRMAALQDRLLAPMPDSVAERAEVLVDIAAGLVMLFAPSLDRKEVMSATFPDLAPIITAGTEANNPGAVFAAPVPKVKDTRPKFSSALKNMAAFMGDERAARRIASKQRCEEILELHKAGRIPLA